MCLIVIMRIYEYGCECVNRAVRVKWMCKRTGYAKSLLLIKFIISHGFAFLFQWAAFGYSSLHVFAFIVEIVTSSTFDLSDFFLFRCIEVCAVCVFKCGHHTHHTATNFIKIQYWLSHIYWDLVCKYGHRGTLIRLAIVLLLLLLS